MDGIQCGSTGGLDRLLSPNTALAIIGLCVILSMALMPNDAPASFKRCLDNHWVGSCIWQIPMKDFVKFYFE